MYEFDFLPVGRSGRSGDAIAARFTHPTTGDYVHVVIDAGFEDSGQALVEHVEEYYDTDTVELALLTHPDGDHIGGMGKVVRGLRVLNLGLHRLAAHGGSSLPASLRGVEDLISTAQAEGTAVFEPFAGDRFFDGALTILSPSEPWYDELVAAQVAEEAGRKAAAAEPSALVEAASRQISRLMKAIGTVGIELPFDDKGGPGPRNNTSLVTLFEIDGARALLTGDAGVAALDRAWGWLEAAGRDSSPPDFIQIPHHGSRKNGSSQLLDRLLGETGQQLQRPAYVSVVDNSDVHPSAKIWNAYYRRGYQPHATGVRKLWWRSPDAPTRLDYGPLYGIGPLDESGED